MKKLFLTSGLVVCIACSVFAATDIPSGVNSSQCTYTYLDSYTGPVAFEAKWRSAYSGAITLNSNKYASSDANSAVQYSATTAVSPSTVYSKYGDALYASCDCSNSTCSTAQASVTEPTLTGYDFGGFYTGKEGTGTQVIDDSGDVLSAANTQISTNCDTATWYAKWTPQEHTVSYSCGSAPVGASVSMSAYCDDTNDEDCSDDVDYDASYTVKTTPGDCVLSGYHFGGWQCDYNLFSGVHTSTTYNSALSNDVYSVTASGAFKSVANVDCDATWTANTYTVSYAMDGGTHGASHPESATYDATFNVSNPTKANNVFTGWTISGMDSGTHEYGATNSLGTTTTNTTLTTNAEYFKNLRSTSGTVTFTAGWEACTACNAGTGCSCELSVVNNTCTYTTSANNGYTLTSGNGTATPVCTAVGSDITLSSTEASNHGTTIIYGKYNVGAYLDSARTTQLMSTSSNAITIPERSGYTFNGYYDSASNGTQYIGSNGNITTDGDNAAKGYTTNQTWYAQWTQCTACNAGTGCSCELSVVNNTCTYTTSANNGYTLTSGNGTATPVCTANTYTVSYTMDGGTQGASHPESATYDATFNVSNPTKDGYTFSGWTISGMDSGTHEYGATNSLGTTTTGTTVTTDAEYFKNLRSTSGTVTFTAGWDADPIPVTFKCLYPNGHTSSDAGASGPTPAIMKIRMDGYATLSSVCTLSGYTFQGWSCSGLTNSSGAALTGTITNGTTVYLHNSSGALCEGVWAPNEIDLTWYLDSGATTGLTVQSAADMCLYDDDITFPTNSMIKNGYSFNGWRLR